MDFSETQKRAIYTKNKNLLVSAAAGSGKTAVLTERIVQTVKDGNPGADSLLVLTFSKAAAAEMQTRIRGRLKELASDPNEKNRGQIIKQLRLLNNEEICTIDSFCCRLVRQFFYKTDIDPSFTPTDNSRLSPLKDKALDKVISEGLVLCDKGEALYATMYDLCDMFSQKDKTNLQDVIYKMYSGLSNLPEPERWLEETQNHLNTDTYEEYLKLLTELVPPAETETASKSKKKKTPLSDYENEESFESYKKMLPSLNLFYALVFDFMKEFYRLKSEKNTYEFSDIERACLRLLRDKDGNETETALSLKNRYAEILTDEYQDTSPLQEEILNILGNGRNRFMVGDIKQSIYAFRNAEPAIFTEKYNSYSENSGLGELVLLSENFRSTSYILKFVNRVFEKIMTKDLGGVEYEPLNFPKNSKYTAADNKKAEVCLILKPTNKISLDDLSDEELAVAEFADSNAKAEALYIAKRIKEIMEEDPGLSYKDFAIISRNLAGSADDISSTLALCGIPAATDKSAESTDFIENKTILSLLRIIDNPLSDIDLTAVLHSPVYRFNAEELAEIKIGAGLERGASFYDLAKAYEEKHDDDIAQRLKAFFEEIDYFKNRFKTDTVSSVLGEIYERTDYYNYLNLLTSGKMRRANLDKLNDLAAEYDASGESGLYGFLNFTDTLIEGKNFKQAQPLSPENNAVRIMTIHGSKGLQFPVVFTVQTGKRIKKPFQTEKAVFSKQVGMALSYFDPNLRISKSSPLTAAARELEIRETMAEEMRLYYVAFTRAEKQLIITACENPGGNTKAEDLDELLDKVTEKYSKSLCSKKSERVPAEKIYKSSTFSSILLGVLADESEDVFTKEFIYRHELTGIIEDINSPVYIKDVSLEKRKKPVYPYEETVNLPTNISVTEIKRRVNEEDRVYYPQSSDKFSLRKPSFMIKKGSKKLMANEIGTAYHTLFSLIDYKNMPKDVETLKDCALSKNLLSKEEAEAIENEKIAAFLASPLAEEISRAKLIKKEHSFTMGLSAKELYPEIKKIKEGEDEIILTHGIIDLWFENEKGITIVDFKTDSNDDFEALKKEYSPQLKLYKTAVEQAVNKPVISTLLYLVRYEKVLTL
ncbi:MAG: UvrD-helicase domain-containing protein [Clostridiales bacterium]|nr:UvrD-helicase domain-containing protein [Clostridiales bacterium]